MNVSIISLTGGDPDFAKCLAIRLAVFVQEQRVPVEHEQDEHDAGALHFLALAAGEAVGTARVIRQDAGRACKIGRVAVLPGWRGGGIGRQLMTAIEAAPALAAAAAFTLDAQVRAVAFYRTLGYRPVGGVFMEAGIAHRRMTKTGPAA